MSFLSFFIGEKKKTASVATSTPSGTGTRKLRRRSMSTTPRA